MVFLLKNLFFRIIKILPKLLYLSIKVQFYGFSFKKYIFQFYEDTSKIMLYKQTDH